LEDHNSEGPFAELGPSSFVGTPEVEDYRPSKSIFVLGLGLMEGDVACPSKKTTILISVEGLNGEALKEAGR
jgi:hypothetical protein